VLLVTFALTVFVDLTVAIEAGMVLAAFSFMHRMAQMVEVGSGVQMLADDEGNGEEDQRASLPDGVEVYRISGPLFFGAANRLDNLMDQLFGKPRCFILRMRQVPLIDASGVHSLQGLIDRCRRKGIVLVVSGLQPQPLQVIRRMGIEDRPGELHFVADFAAACALAREIADGPLVEEIAGI
jgi:SulP family sulfate permease